MLCQMCQRSFTVYNGNLYCHNCCNEIILKPLRAAHTKLAEQAADLKKLVQRDVDASLQSLKPRLAVIALLKRRVYFSQLIVDAQAADIGRRKAALKSRRKMLSVPFSLGDGAPVSRNASSLHASVQSRNALIRQVVNMLNYRRLEHGRHTVLQFDIDGDLELDVEHFNFVLSTLVDMFRQLVSCCLVQIEIGLGSLH